MISVTIKNMNVSLPFNWKHPTVMNWANHQKLFGQMITKVNHDREECNREYTLQIAQNQVDITLELMDFLHLQFPDT